MEGMRAATPFVRYLADRLGGNNFTLLDVGCSSGIDVAWREFGTRLRAFGFDPNLREVARLNANEKLAGVEYVAAFVGVPADDPGSARMRSGMFWAHNPWGRLSIARTIEIHAAQIANSTNAEKTKLNQWSQVELADRAQPVILTDFLRERGVDDVDFIKLDVDGADLLILRSLRKMLDETHVLGVGIEVNFFGSDDPDINTFHNVDRFLKAVGFELFDLSVRRYSAAALPAPYIYTIANQGAWGRILQGDALYLRDAASLEHKCWAESIGSHKLAKLAAIFSIFGLPDCAAEILQCFRAEFSLLLDVNSALDTLVEQCIPAGKPVPSYADYIQEFENDGARFYPARQTAVRLNRIRRALVRRTLTGLSTWLGAWLDSRRWS